MNAVSVTEKNLHSRSRARQSEFRKQQLIEATIDCIDKFGLSQTTLATIAKQAGVSQGNVIFHFQSKDFLLEQALRHHSDEYMRCWREALNEAGNDPVAQLCAMVSAPFKASICNRKKISVWYAFWGEARSRPIYMSICGQHDHEYSEVLLEICREIEKGTNAALSVETAALSIETMRDGLWQNFLIGPSGFNRQQALQGISDLVAVIYPEHSYTIKRLVRNP